MATIIFPCHLIRKENIVTDNIHQNTHSSPNDTHTLGTRCWELVWPPAPPEPPCVQETTSSSQNGLLINAICSKQSNSQTVKHKHKHARNGNCLGDMAGLHAVSTLALLLFGLPLHRHLFFRPRQSLCAVTLPERYRTPRRELFTWQNKQLKVKRSGWMAVDSIETHLGGGRL